MCTQYVVQVDSGSHATPIPYGGVCISGDSISVGYQDDTGPGYGYSGRLMEQLAGDREYAPGVFWQGKNAYSVPSNTGYVNAQAGATWVTVLAGNSLSYLQSLPGAAVAIHVLGRNDLADTTGDIATCRGRAVTALTYAHSINSTVRHLLVGVPPHGTDTPNGWADSLNVEYQDIVNNPGTYGLSALDLTYVDLDNANWNRPVDCHATEPAHPTASGHDRMANAIGPALFRAFGFSGSLWVPL